MKMLSRYRPRPSIEMRTPASVSVVIQADPVNWLGSVKDLSHLWMPPVMQAVFGTAQDVIGCGHLSGLSVRL